MRGRGWQRILGRRGRPPFWWRLAVLVGGLLLLGTAYQVASSTAVYIAVVALVLGAQNLAGRWFSREDDFTRAMDAGYEWQPSALVTGTIILSLVAAVAVFFAIVALVEPAVGWVFWLVALFEVCGEAMTRWSEHEFKRHPPEPSQR